MLTVITKQLLKNGKWGCSCTFKCYDHYETGHTVVEAQSKMSEKFKKMGYEGEIKFEEPKGYRYTQLEPRYSAGSDFSIRGIDKGMV